MNNPSLPLHTPTTNHNHLTQVFYFSDMKDGYKANSRLIGLRGKRVSDMGQE